MTLKNMMIKNVTLENIKSFIDFKRDLYKGCGFILGDNGTGKTTILLSIGSILGFLSPKSLLRDGSSKGSIRLLIQIDGKEYDIYKELTRKGSSVVSSQCTVKDEQGLHKFDSTELKEYTLNILNIKDSRSVKSKSEIFKYAIYCPQGEMIKILSTKKADIDERNQTLRKTFRTEEYKNARDIAEKLENKIGKKVIYLKGQSDDIDKDRNQLILEDREIGRISNANNTLASRREEYKREIEGLSAIKKSKEDERDTYTDSKGRIKQIGEEIKRLEGEKSDIIGANGSIKKLEEQIGSIDKQNIELKRQSTEIYKNIDRSLGTSIEELKKKIEKLRKEKENKVEESKQYIDIGTDIKLAEKDIDSTEEDRKDIIIDIERHGTENSRIDSEISKLLKTLPINKTLEELEKEKEKVDSDIRELLVCKGIIEKNIKEYAKVKDVPTCYTCGQKIDKNVLEDNIVINKEECKNIEERLRKYYEQLEIIKRSIGIQEEISSYNINKKEIKIKIELCEEKILETDKKIDSLKSNLFINHGKMEIYNDLLKCIGDIEHDIEFTNTNISNMERYDGIQERIMLYEQNILTIRGQINESVTRLSNIDSKISSLIKDKDLCTKESELYDMLSDDIRSIDLDVATKIRELKDVDIQTAKNDAVIKEKDNVIRGFRTKIGDKEKQIQTYKFLEEYEIFLNKCFIPATMKIERKIFTRMRNKFNRYLQELSLSIMNKKNIKVEINEDFTPIITRNSVIVDIDDDSVSGGEQASIAFAYRVALNMLVSELVGINLPLIFDEPTYGFSQNKLTNLRNSIRDLRLKGLKDKHVIIVSHEEKFRDVADYVIKLVSIDEKTSIVED